MVLLNATDDRLRAALDRLVERGVLDDRQAGAVLAEVAAPRRENRGRPPWGEIAGYLGASLVLGAILLFLAGQWGGLDWGSRVAVLTGLAVLLVTAGLVVGRRPSEDVSRRLASTLLTGAAGAAGFAVYVAFDQAFVASLTGLAVVSAGYLLASSAVGQLGVAVAAFLLYASLLDWREVLDGPTPLGAGVLLLGVVWAVVPWPERRFGRAVAVVLGLSGAQLVVIDDDILGYALTAAVAVACFAWYARERDWVLLAGGVVGATVVTPEILYEVTGGSIGGSGAMLVAGVILIAGSVLGVRMKR
ncbi:hypothetical protein ACTI_42200 [Actinoplanes sp. OR16]|uniref:DUF2157 domain-containing protein n=1 Tax=Actinoplanes sp. OR16 TaxID=946334 RepID=UPI000F6F9A47|nr:DUF2157 domain-containing protein [Actinoplanes sp. OR16]BBH67535.1 hypothetical protein ACTI_42200 [Actinoplanes sp. OR16]